MLAVALGLKLISLEEIYKELGKLVCAEPVPKENEAATWREKLDQLYKSSSQSLRVVVHGAKIGIIHISLLIQSMKLLRLKGSGKWRCKGISIKEGNQYIGVLHLELLLQRLNWRKYFEFCRIYDVATATTQNK